MERGEICGERGRRGVEERGERGEGVKERVEVRGRGKGTREIGRAHV